MVRLKFVYPITKWIFWRYRVALEWCAGLRVLRNSGAADDIFWLYLHIAPAKVGRVLVEVRRSLLSLLFAYASVVG